ncbi:MAG: hypothetical protein ACYC96_01345 [Fimbriimonadaceae bacterium]
MRQIWPVRLIAVVSLISGSFFLAETEAHAYSPVFVNSSGTIMYPMRWGKQDDPVKDAIPFPPAFQNVSCWQTSSPIVVGLQQEPNDPPATGWHISSCYLQSLISQAVLWSWTYSGPQPQPVLPMSQIFTCPGTMPAYVDDCQLVVQVEVQEQAGGWNSPGPRVPDEETVALGGQSGGIASYEMYSVRRLYT